MFLGHLVTLQYMAADMHTKDKKLGGIARTFTCDLLQLDTDLASIQKQDGDDLLSIVTRQILQKSNRDTREYRDHRDNRDHRGNRDHRDNRDTRDYRDSRDTRDHRDSRDTRDHRNNQDRDAQSQKRQRDHTTLFCPHCHDRGHQAAAVTHNETDCWHKNKQRRPGPTQ
ncbi:unnamed protein product [Bodo saltans]|uniref:Uncharacterized protein n=1 Tax=Bodo saltans TaxID=75058 RepID=A0A0S4JGI5_BODSA|nr:unnamed protein product [Bodo saltans]|eukprot:CUG89227.1 unnamed protein product [Bodo saltans]